MKKLIVILGPTASGKTKLAVKLARIFNGEIISADSRQVYRGMDIGTGKDLKSYQLPATSYQLPTKIPYHLIDIVNPATQFNVAKFKSRADRAISDVLKRGKMPFLVGGSGLWISAVVDNYKIPRIKPNRILRDKIESMTQREKVKLLKKIDCDALTIIDFKNPRRLTRTLEICLQGQKYSSLYPSHPPYPSYPSYPTYHSLQIGLALPKETLNQRIDQRIDKRIKQGMINEVAALHKNGVSWKRLNDFGLEYRFISRHLRGQLKKDEMLRLLKTASHQFAKRQMTWFKRDKRTNWVKNEKQTKKLIQKFLSP